MVHRTPKKPKESREQIITSIMVRAAELKMDDLGLLCFILTYFTAVDLEMILADLRSASGKST